MKGLKKEKEKPGKKKGKKRKEGQRVYPPRGPKGLRVYIRVQGFKGLRV